MSVLPNPESLESYSVQANLITPELLKAQAAPSTVLLAFLALTGAAFIILMILLIPALPVWGQSGWHTSMSGESRLP
jgi:hypothetical protein